MNCLDYRIFLLTLGKGLRQTPKQSERPEHQSGLPFPRPHESGDAKSRTGLSDITFTFHFHALENEMATHSGVLAWRIPETGKPGGLPSMGSHRVRQD